MIDRTSALGLWRYAHEYWQAAEAVHAKFPGTVFVPGYYLYGHTIELALKAFLRARGWSVARIRALGHDLEAALKAAEDEGLGVFVTFSTDDRDAIALLNPYYDAKELEYIVTGVKHYPTARILRDCAGTVVRGTKGSCEVAARAAK